MRKTSEIVAEVVEISRLTAADMAKMAAIHQGTLSKYVSGKLEPDPSWAVKFVQLLGGLHERRRERLWELKIEAEQLWHETPEFKEMFKLLRADMEARGKVKQKGRRKGGKKS